MAMWRDDHTNSYTKLVRRTWKICNVIVGAVFYYGLENLSSFITRKPLCVLRKNKRVLFCLKLRIFSENPSAAIVV